MTPVEITRGDSPVILGLPHTGTYLPDDMRANLRADAQDLRDTDWHVHTLYDGLLPGATTVRATFHRYVIDANRDPTGKSLYPGQNTTGLVPVTDFDGAPLWQVDPTEDEIHIRRAAFHAPYHAALTEEIARIKAIHGVAVLYDCHSIRSNIPHLFDGTLPDLNIGTNDGRSCAKMLSDTVERICRSNQTYSTVLNGRFKGGWTTRHYGRPGAGVHAIQMELAQSTHLVSEDPPFDYDPIKAAALRETLARILKTLETMSLSLRTLP
ncbi:MAG: N-formylglutamate deformylase [Pseudomonadota bacterium]